MAIYILLALLVIVVATLSTCIVDCTTQHITGGADLNKVSTLDKIPVDPHDMSKMNRSDFMAKIAHHQIPFPYFRTFMKWEEILARMKNLKAHQTKLKDGVAHIKALSGVPAEKLTFNGRPQYICESAEYYDLYNPISDWFTEEARMNSRKIHEKESPYEYFYSHAGEIYDHCMKKYARLSLRGLRESLYDLFGHGECATFRSNLVVDMVSMFGARTMLDPSAGWGNRLIGAIASNLNEYVGVDPNTALVRGHKEIIRSLGQGKMLKVICAPFEDTTEAQGVIRDYFDLVFTSPPYLDLEIYSNEPTQASSRHSDGTKMFKDFLIPYLRKAFDCVRCGGWFVININDSRSIPPFVSRMLEQVDAFPEAKYMGCLPFYEDHNAKKSAQPIWIWRKVV